MSSSSIDTDTLVALVLSTITTLNPSQEDVLEALVQAQGDVQEAAAILQQQQRGKRRASKRKSLEDWLMRSPSKKTKHDAPNAKTVDTGEYSNSSTITTRDRIASGSKRPVANLMSVLNRLPSGPKKALIPRLPPLMLSNPALVEKHTPCTMHLSILPPELACSLFYTMLDLSNHWKRNKWWLFDRLVESPHRTSFFARRIDDGDQQSWHEAAQFWYNGRKTDPPEAFPPAMEEACKIVERVVNEEMKRRTRYPLEWAGKLKEQNIWSANVAASNCYEGGKESVGWHSDQLTYLGPYPTIASLSLGVRRIFSLREVIPKDEAETRRARTFNIPLPHNSLTIMHASCQEKFKHSIPPQSAVDLYHPQFPRDGETCSDPSSCRINITFRFYRPDFHPSAIPRCKCDVPTILRPDMKNRTDGLTDKYWWTCYAGAQNDGKGCNVWQVMDMQAEGRGPCIGDERAEC